VPGAMSVYCAGCLKTQSFVDVGRYYVCPICGKRLDKAVSQPTSQENLDLRNNEDQ